jgi:hypothetical protein
VCGLFYLLLLRRILSELFPSLNPQFTSVTWFEALDDVSDRNDVTMQFPNRSILLVADAGFAAIVYCYKVMSFYVVSNGEMSISAALERIRSEVNVTDQ